VDALTSSSVSCASAPRRLVPNVKPNARPEQSDEFTIGIERHLRVDRALHSPIRDAPLPFRVLLSNPQLPALNVVWGWRSCPIDHVENLDAELRLSPFFDVKFLEQRRIALKSPGP